MAKFFFAPSRKKHIDQSPLLRRLMWAFEGAVLTMLWRLSACLSPDRASAVGRKLMTVAGPYITHKTRILKHNLRLAFPDRSTAEIAGLAREIWGSFGAVLAEYPHMKTICSEEENPRIEAVIKGDIQVFHKREKRAVFVSAHLANWEISPYAAERLGIPIKVVYDALQNPWLDRMVRRQREALGCGLISNEDDMREIVRQLAAGKSIGIVIDRRTDTGEPVPFFGLDKPTTVIPARLALRFNCELIPVRVERLCGARFRVTFHEPVSYEEGTTDKQEKILQMTRKVNQVFESWIREQSHEWLCSNRIWPKMTKPLKS